MDRITDRTTFTDTGNAADDAGSLSGLIGKREDGALPALEGDLSRVFLVGAGEERYMDELARLAATLGLEVVGRMEQNRRDGTGYIGRGKRAELAEEVRASGAGVVITDDELTASQSRVLERDCDAPVVDRTELIIRIFHQHAHDAPSKLQVELAEVSYLLPRVRGMWRHLERLGGGSAGSAGSSGSSAAGGRATRGPGEQQLEYDRRQLRERMERLKKRLSEEGDSRLVRRSRLRGNTIPKVALVGYTNAGKTTVLNALSGADRVTRDRLFETLETTTRQVEGSSTPETEGGGYTPDFTLTDTVGFIRKLPTQLVESFSSTLEAAEDADIIILCADASSPEVEEEIQIVKRTVEDGLVKGRKRKTLPETSAPEQPPNSQIILLNKLDLLDDERRRELEGTYPGAIFCDHVSGYDPLKEEIVSRVADMGRKMELLIPHSRYGDVAGLYGMARIYDIEETTDGVRVNADIPSEKATHYEQYRI